MKSIIMDITGIMMEKFPKRKILAILNWLDTPEEAQQLLEWIQQQDIEELDVPAILDKIHEIQKR